MESRAEKELLRELNDLSSEELLEWSWRKFGDGAAIITSFQDTGCVIVDISRRVAPKLRVVTVDTLRLHGETYELMRRMEERYGLRIERIEPDPDRVGKMVERHGEYLFFDGVAKQEHCCSIRKVEPHQRALKGVEAWITGLRRDTGNLRRDTPKAAIVENDGRSIVKLSPLADWTDQQVWQYIRDNDVPYSQLYEKGYTSIGCRICTTPTLPGEPKRAGRWRWLNQFGPDHHKECGIHIDGSGI